jgi:DNA-binding NarL/FixJ family response regulator
MPNWPAVDHALPEKRGSKRAQSEEPGKRRTAEERTAGRERVLIVEDDFFVSLEMETALTDSGFEVLGPANTAEEAEDYALEQRPDLVVMDVRLLSHRDGVEAALTIFRTTGIRSIFATAHDDPHTRARAAEAKPLGWIAKPYAMDALVALVRQALKEAKN